VKLLYAVLIFVYLFKIYLIFSVMFIFSARNFYFRRIRNEKPALNTGAKKILGAGKWGRFMAPVSRMCVMGLSLNTKYYTTRVGPSCMSVI